LKPLPEQFDVADPNEAYAAALLKDVGPLEPSATRKRRVWNALQRSAAKRPRARFSVPVVAGLVLFGATAASATLPQLWRRFQPAVVEALAIAPESTNTTPRRAPRHPSASKVHLESAGSESTSLETSAPGPVVPPPEPLPAMAAAPTSCSDPARSTR
jgi:hypothetical protein